MLQRETARSRGPFSVCEGGGYGSVADGEALADMARPLDLVGKRDGVVLERDAAASLVGEQLVRSQPEHPRALARDEQRRGRKEGPFQRRVAPQPLKKGDAPEGFVAVLRREVRSVDQQLARRDLQAARATDHQVSA